MQPAALRIMQKIAGDALAGRRDLLLACRDIVDVKTGMKDLPNGVADILIAVVSEIDGMPVGDERAFWAVEALRDADDALTHYRKQVAEPVT